MNDSGLDNRITGILAGGGRAIVLGLGISNEPMARMLAGQGMRDRLIIRDGKTSKELGGKIFDLAMCGAVADIGREPTEGLCDREDMSGTVIFRSPGIRPDAGDIPEAVRRGALLTSEMEWFCSRTPARIVAVTGSDGKTTTTTLTHLLLSRSGKSGNVYVGGNIGNPLLDAADEMSGRDTAVLELSSFQLQTMNGPADRAAITNISPNHLNWHTSMEEYTEAKYRVFGENTELLVLNAKSGPSRAAADRFGGHVTFFTARNADGETFEALTGGRPDSSLVFLRGDDIVFSDGKSETTVLRRPDILLPGLHNVENYMTAFALTRGLCVPEVLAETAKTFGGVEHRLEFVRELRGVKYYNSSIDSSPSRSVAALSTMNNRPVIICGGRDKHVPFDPLAKAVFDRASAVVLTGEAAPQIMEALEREAALRGGFGRLGVITAEAFEDAVFAASEAAEAGSAVLLSPGCTSFDRFANFEERGRYFKKLVMSLE